MERIYIDNNSKLHKVMALRGGISPISNSPGCVYNHPRRSPGFDLRANSNVLSNLENLDSRIVRYYRSGGSPLSAIENLEISPKTMYTTTLKVEEDVLVMDGILVEPVTASRVRSSSSTSDSRGSSSSGGKSFYKTEICRSWEDFGSCRYGAKCQFAHGKEELRTTRFLNKSKSETSKSCNSGSGSHGSKCQFTHEQNNSPASGTDFQFTTASLMSRGVSENNSPASATDSPVSAISSKTQIVLPTKLEKAMNCAERSPLTTQTVTQNNSPTSAMDSPVSANSSKTETVVPMKLEQAMNFAGRSPLITRTVSQNNSPASATDSPASANSSKTQTVLPMKLEQTINCAGRSLTTRIVSQNNSPASATNSPDCVIPSKTQSVLPINLEKAVNCAGKSFLITPTVLQHNSPASRTRIVSPIKLEKTVNGAEKSSSTTQTVSPIKLQNAMNFSESFTFASSNWSPVDDGIEVAVPCSSLADKALSREEVDAYINSVLYGSNNRKTLPLFAAICPR